MIQSHIRILHLEDDAADAMLIKEKLEVADLPCRVAHVQSRQEYEQELASGDYDLVLADYKLPGYDGISALRYKLKQRSDIPFIFVSGTIGEDAAIEGLLEGATDYVLKQKLSRLVPAIRRALGEFDAIRERKQAEDALRRSEYKKSILNEIASIFLSTPDREVHETVITYLIRLTDSQAGSFGYLERNGDLVLPNFGNGIWKPLADEAFSAFPPSVWRGTSIEAAFKAGETLTQRSPYSLPGDVAPFANLMTTPVALGEEPIGVLCFGSDRRGFSADCVSLMNEIAKFISPVINARLQRDRHEKRRRQVELELIAAKEKAEENDRLKTAFLQNLSHEIRTPMNAICGFSSLLNDPKISEEERKSFTRIIATSSNQLLSIVTDILTMASIETRQVEVNRHTVSVKRVLLDVIEVFRPQASERGLRLCINQGDGSADLTLTTDRDKLLQILNNLLANALKFTKAGFVEIGYRAKYEGANRVVEFRVQDTGIGVDPAAQQVIFERFRQASADLGVEYGGMGLGLSISKGLVELLGGRMWLESEPGCGATFYFTLPLENEVAKPEPNDRAQAVATAPGRTALVVEDDEFSKRYLQAMLESMDLRVICARDGRQAVAICRENPDISFVLMDLRLPVMDGCEAAKAIRIYRPGLPIIAQTAYVSEIAKETTRDLFDDVVAKPLDPAVLARTISEL